MPKINLKIKHNFIGYIPPETESRFPGKDDDETRGYSVHSLWYDPVSENIFSCGDPTAGDAKWSLVQADSRIVNNTAGVILAFRFVRALDDQGGHTEVTYADASDDDNYYGITGMTFKDLQISDQSFQAISGMVVRGVPLPTATWIGGQRGFLQNSSGQWGPTPGTHRVSVFTVLKAHETQGVVLIDIVRGIELKEIDDVADIDPTINGQFQGYNLTDSKYKPTTIESTDDHLVVGYTGGGSPSIDLTVVNTICHFPDGLEFGSTTQQYDVSGTDWKSAVAGGSLGGIPDETEDGHKLADCLAAMQVAREGDYLSVQEKAGGATPTNPNTIHFLFEDITKFDTLDLRMQYFGASSHNMAFEFWNYTTSSWSRLGEFTDTGAYIEISQKVFGSVNFIGTGGDAGKVKLQIIHDSNGVATHYMAFDLVSICDGGGGGGAASQNVYNEITGDSGSTNPTTPDSSLAIEGDQGIETTVTAGRAGVAVSDAVYAGTKAEIIFTLDDGGSVLTTGVKKAYIYMPHAGEIIEATLLADPSGSIVIDVWADSYANFPPTVADSIVASAPPTITSAIKSQDSTLTGWDKTFPAGTIFEVSIQSNTGITKCFLILKYNKTGV